MSLMSNEDLEKLAECVVQLDLKGAQSLVDGMLNRGIAPYTIIAEGLSKGMEEVGKKYESGEYFLSELLTAAAVMKGAMKSLEPFVKFPPKEKKGTVVIGTVRGDLHDVGKNVFISLLGGAGFDVVDLGVDVPAEKFVEAIRQHKPTIVGMSALITTTIDEMGTVIKALQDSEVRKGVKVILGGTPVTEAFGRAIGADAAVNDAMAGLRICNRWAEEEAGQRGDGT
jgi:5-methyltetrahydrofolate--homocysteine methyltransferase